MATSSSYPTHKEHTLKSGGSWTKACAGGDASAPSAPEEYTEWKAMTRGDQRLILLAQPPAHGAERRWQPELDP